MAKGREQDQEQDLGDPRYCLNWKGIIAICIRKRTDRRERGRAREGEWVREWVRERAFGRDPVPPPPYLFAFAFAQGPREFQVEDALTRTHRMINKFFSSIFYELFSLFLPLSIFFAACFIQISFARFVWSFAWRWDEQTLGKDASRRLLHLLLLSEPGNIRASSRRKLSFSD